MNKKSVFSCFIVIFFYYVLRLMNKSPSLPSIKDISNSAIIIFTSSDFYTNALYTIKIVSLGVFISLVAGTFIAILCSMNSIANSLIMPIINSTKNIPSITLFPLFIVLMGIGDTPRISIIIWNSIYPIISSTMMGLDSVDKDVIDAGKNCGANKFQIYFYIKIPLAILYILNGLKISLSNGFIAIVVAEMLGATKGLGYMILWSANTFQYPQMYVYILVIALIGFLINVIIEKIIKITERKIFDEEKKSNKSSINFNVTNNRNIFCRMFCKKDRTETVRRKGTYNVLRWIKSL